MFEHRFDVLRTDGHDDGGQRVPDLLGERGAEGREAFVMEPVPGGYRRWFRRKQPAVEQGPERAQ